MNRKIFVTYGNSNYYSSLERIGKEAVETGEFDEVLVYTDKDLPMEILQHELMKYKRGGGYWLWKPWAILHALQVADEGDYIFYSDCGNTLYRHGEWESYFSYLKNNDYLLFYNGGKMKVWTKKLLLEQFHRAIGECYQVMSGAIFLKKNTSNNLIQQWYDLMFKYPEFVIDVPSCDKSNEPPCFVEHRHDQAVLSCLAYSKEIRSLEKVTFLPQRAEMLRHNGQAFFHSRISDDNVRSSAVVEARYKTLIKDWFVRPYRMLKTKLCLKEIGCAK